jgi:integrase
VAYRRGLNPSCQLNHDKRQLSRILIYAHNEGLIPKIPKLKSVDSEAEGGRCLSDAELSALYREANQDLRDEIDLSVRMAFRQIDTRNLTVDRVDFKKEEIRFERGMRSDEGGQKNKKPVVIKINPVCLAILKRRAATLKGRYFFPSPLNPDRPMSSNKTAWYATCKRAKVNAGFHCLRHTCATLMARAGVPEAFTQKFCRMSAPVIRKIYTHLEAEDSSLVANTIVRSWLPDESPSKGAK